MDKREGDSASLERGVPANRFLCMLYETVLDFGRAQVMVSSRSYRSVHG